ncbi:MAG: branched-chain amino acid ABC transporter permease [Saprospiraceae bacterium]|nr:branched-chain amino acid ABC transporter permease [Candidatus Vicinibacter affinis]
MLTQFILNGLITGILYGLMALGFSLTYYTTRIFHIAFAGILIITPYIFLLLYSSGLPFVIIAILSVAIAGMCNLLIECFIYKPMEKGKSSHNNLLIASIGVLIVITNLVAMTFGSENQIFKFKALRAIEYENLIITYMQILQMIGGVSLISLVLLLLYKTRIGLYIRAISDDKILLMVFGINIYRIRSLLFLFSGVIAATVSLFLAFEVGFDPYGGMPLLLNAMVAMIIGGVGSFKGTIAGGMILGIVQSLSVYAFETKWESAITFGMLLLILLFRPIGLFGQQERLV